MRKREESTYYKVKDEYPFIAIILSYILRRSTYGDPQSPLLWTSKSLRKIKCALRSLGVFISHTTIGKLLRESGYSSKKNKKMEQIGKKHPDADAQMINISLKIEKFQQEGFVILSVDCKKKGATRGLYLMWMEQPLNWMSRSIKN
ncbi:MAG: hypothetical protein IJU76_05590 [Desulfovibrionaceae bacterium]|nr:hypothetical protein [Desulfovibrionaceae bacterium]